VTGKCNDGSLEENVTLWGMKRCNWRLGDCEAPGYISLPTRRQCGSPRASERSSHASIHRVLPDEAPSMLVPQRREHRWCMMYRVSDGYDLGTGG
jgi:hypothetical protein